MKITMKLAAIAVTALTLVLAASTPRARGATPKPKTIASYCSTSGDVCYGIFNRSGKVSLEITTAARYFNRYTLCVRRLPPRGTPEYAQRCGLSPSFVRAARRGGRAWATRANTL